MPREKPGHKQLTVVLPLSLLAELDSVCAETGRSQVAEIAHAIERHVRQRPKVVVPPLTEVVVEKKKRGRPRKQSG